jgi:hypothetical protein
MSTAFGFMWAVGYVGAFISPFLAGALVPLLGLRGVMAGSLTARRCESSYRLALEGP